MTLPQFTAIFAATGVLVPVVFRAMWYFLNQSANVKAGLIMEKLMLVLWPTSLMTLPASPDPGFETKLFLISMIANVVVYGVLGLLIWLGLRKHVSFLALAGFPLFAVWWWLLTR